MPLVARVGDRTDGSGSHGMKCCGHSFSGMHTMGDFTTYIEDAPVTRLTDLGVHYCPHCAVNMNIKSTKTVYYGNLPSHCLGQDVTEFCGMGTSTRANHTVYDED